MARCGPLHRVIDTDTPGWPFRGACVVHGHLAPCPLDGEPAVDAPLHGDCRPSAEAALEHHRRVTLMQRPLVLHMGAFTDCGPAGEEHVITDDAAAGCWCGAVVYEPVALA